MFSFNYKNIFRLFKDQWICLNPKTRKLNDINIERPIDLYVPYFSCAKLNKAPIFKRNTFSEHLINFDTYKACEDHWRPNSLIYEVYVKTNSKLAAIRTGNINNPYIKKVMPYFNIEEEVETYDSIIKTCFKNSVELLGGKIYDIRKY